MRVVLFLLLDFFFFGRILLRSFNGLLFCHNFIFVVILIGCAGCLLWILMSVRTGLLDLLVRTFLSRNFVCRSWAVVQIGCAEFILWSFVTALVRFPILLVRFVLRQRLFRRRRLLSLLVVDNLALLYRLCRRFILLIIIITIILVLI